MSIPVFIKGSKFHDRIEFLYDRQVLSNAYIRDGFPFCKPNCWGTSAYISGLHEQVERICRESGFEPFNYADAMGDFVMPSSLGPGYIGEEPFRLVLATLQRCGPEPDSIVAFSWDTMHDEACGYHLRHAAIHLGNGLLFHQEGEGCAFEFSSLEKYVGEREKSRDVKIDVEFYQV